MTLMFRKADQILCRQSHVRLAVFSLLIVGVVGASDHMTGYELSFSIFYLIPVGLAAWYLPGQSGLIFSAISAAT